MRIRLKSLGNILARLALAWLCLAFVERWARAERPRKRSDGSLLITDFIVKIYMHSKRKQGWGTFESPD